MSEKNVVEEIIEAAIAGEGLSTVATAEPAEVYALVSALHPSIVDDAKKTIILAKQEKMIHALQQDQVKGTDVPEDPEKDAEAPADTDD